MKTQDRRSHRASGVGSRLLPSNWRVRPRLVALILLPTAAAMVLTGLQLTSSLASAGEYRRMTEVATLVEQLGTLSHEMAEERDLTAWYIVDHRGPRRFAKVKQQRQVVNQISTQVQKSIDGLDPEQAARVLTETSQVSRWLKGLPGLRKPMEGSVLPRAALGIYSRMIDDFITLHDDLGRSGGDERLIGDALALGALTRAKEQVARQRGILLVGLEERKFDFDDPAEFLGAYKSQLSEVASFRATASPSDVKRFDQAVSGPDIDQADSTTALVRSLMREFKPLPVMRATEINGWFAVSTATVDAMRTVERGLSAAVVARSQEMQSNEQRSAIISGAAILILLILILLITAWVAGTLVRPLRRLRSEALEVADTRLPETVRVLRESGDLAPNVEVPSIGVASRDEIGEVARAFDEVHREAIRLAGDEARLRNNVNAMFVNLSRRTQSLVERQIDLIDDLEQGEQDDGRLSSLFKLDHLATRMRRNSENLLVLAGQEQSRRWSEPVPLSDVVRASLSEVENYERVSLRVESGTSIIGSAVNDIVHLIAELVENAIFFSPQDTKITVTSNSNETGAIILAVTDMGIGMSDEELAEVNRRLAEPPAVDLSVSRRMGLFVVGRLAMRHGIRVQLRRPDIGGLSAVVLLPLQVVAQAQPAMVGQGGAAALGIGSRTDSFGTGSSQDPFGAGQSQDPFGAGPDPDPFASAWGSASRPSPVHSAPVPPPAADLWSAPVVSASAVEDLWSSPFTSASSPPAPQSAPAPQPSAPSAWPEVPPIDPWTPQRQEAVENTQNLPAVEVSSTEPEPEEFLPIFAAVGSDWFRSGPAAELPPEPGIESMFSSGPPDSAETTARPKPLDTVRPRPLDQPVQEPQPASEAPPLPVRQPRQDPSAERQPWSTPSDQGWAAAEVAKKPVEGGTTGAGLPKRVPKANLVPGAASAAQTAPPAMPPISADRVRSRLSSFQQGVRQGRAEMNERSNAAEGEKQ
ncbi:nitrate- and nitrite sensing domain-containing protein [Streptosporangium sp. NBC_01639]|uniref:sensor histidine kinase n=1 Tax=Streptosporangium sp. NBC_01639 TaxID=2975948 RepID=UPI003870E338|nr:nitrate- and nitrite sensing domain-containing protein [Streptosporangium sp. NBC_01639]